MIANVLLPADSFEPVIQRQVTTSADSVTAVTRGNTVHTKD